MLQIFEQKPKNFFPLVTIVGCYCLYRDTVLLLKRHPETVSGEKWCLPAGKLEEGESLQEGALREFREEVGLPLSFNRLVYLGTVYICFPEYAYDFVIYHIHFEEKPKLQLNLEEHTEALWVTHSDAMHLPLIQGGERILTYCATHVKL